MSDMQHDTRGGARQAIGWQRSLRRARRALFAAVEALVFALVVVILALVSTQVFTRYVLHVPVNWLEEAARMTLVWLVMLGAAVAAERREHYVIDMIVRKLPGRVALVTLVVTNLLAIAFLAVLATTGTEYVRSSLSTFYVSLNVPRGYVYVAIPLGALLMGFSLVAQTVEAWLSAKANPADLGADLLPTPLPHE